jgi:hypothetical protein
MLLIVLILDRMLGKKWTPHYFSSPRRIEISKIDMGEENKADESKKKKPKARQDLSTKGGHSVSK